jgi:isoquinoline 1-oxidoreductase beta subunit
MGVANKLSDGPSRRHLLTGGLAGGFLLAFHVPVRAANEPVPMAYTPEGPFAPNAFIRIDTAGKTTLVMPQVEMGQGIYTAVAMILAEELDADFAQVALQHAPPSDKLYANPLLGLQATGGSTSVRAFWLPLRKAGAGARAMLVQAAPWPRPRASSRRRATFRSRIRRISP